MEIWDVHSHGLARRGLTLEMTARSWCRSSTAASCLKRRLSAILSIISEPVFSASVVKNQEKKPDEITDRQSDFTKTARGVSLKTNRAYCSER